VRRFTLITLLVLFVALAATAVFQLLLAGGEGPRYPGPVPGTPVPTVSPGG
jgi:hypothetical protein